MATAKKRKKAAKKAAKSQATKRKKAAKKAAKSRATQPTTPRKRKGSQSTTPRKRKATQSTTPRKRKGSQSTTPRKRKATQSTTPRKRKGSQATKRKKAAKKAAKSQATKRKKAAKSQATRKGAQSTTPRKRRGSSAPRPAKRKGARVTAPAKKAGKRKGAQSRTPRKKAASAPPAVTQSPETQGPPAAPERPKPKFQRGSNIYVIETADPTGFSEPIDRAEMLERSMISSSQNSVFRDNYAEVLGAWFQNYCAKALVGDPDTVPIWRFGVMFVSDYDGQDSRLLIDPVRRLLMRTIPRTWAAHIVAEAGDITVRIGLGSYTEASTANEALISVWENEQRLSEIVEALAKITGGGYWFAFMDVPVEYATSEPAHGERRAARTERARSRRMPASGGLWQGDASMPGPITRPAQPHPSARGGRRKR